MAEDNTIDQLKTTVDDLKGIVDDFRTVDAGPRALDNVIAEINQNQEKIAKQTETMGVGQELILIEFNEVKGQNAKIIRSTDRIIQEVFENNQILNELKNRTGGTITPEGPSESAKKKVSLGLLAMLISALAVAGGLLWLFRDEIADFAKAIWDNIAGFFTEDIPKIWDQFTTWAGDHMNAIWHGFLAVVKAGMIWDKLMLAVDSIKAVAGKIWTGFLAVIKAELIWDKIMLAADSISAVAGKVWDAVSFAWDNTIGLAFKFGKKIWDGVIAAWDMIAGLPVRLAELIWSAVTFVPKFLVKLIWSGIKAGWNAVSTAIVDLVWGGIKSAWTRISASFGDMLSTAFKKLTSSLDFIIPIAKTFWESLIGAGSAIGKGASKVFKGAKLLFKSMIKKIPIIGALASIWFAYQKVQDGDYWGAVLEVASGLLSIVPVIGTAASFGVDALIATREMGAFDGTAFAVPGTDGETEDPGSLEDEKGNKITDVSVIKAMAQTAASRGDTAEAARLKGMAEGMMAINRSMGMGVDNSEMPPAQKSPAAPAAPLGSSEDGSVHGVDQTTIYASVNS